MWLVTSFNPKRDCVEQLIVPSEDISGSFPIPKGDCGSGTYIAIHTRRRRWFPLKGIMVEELHLGRYSLAFYLVSIPKRDYGSGTS